MAFQSIFVDTKLPHDIVNIIEEDVKQFDVELCESKVKGCDEGRLNLKKRNFLLLLKKNKIFTII